MGRLMGSLCVLGLLAGLSDSGNAAFAGEAEESVKAAEANSAVSEDEAETASAWGEDPWKDEEEPVDAPPEQIYDLDRVIDLALRRNRAIQASNWEMAYYNAQADEAWWAWFPKITLTTVVSTSPDYGKPPRDADGFLDWEQRDNRFDGVTWGNEIKVQIPLYTFGKISNLRDMGPLAVDAGRLKRRAVKDRMIYEAKRVYYTIQFLNVLREKLDEGMGYLKDAEEKLERLLADGSATVTEIDRYKFEVVRADLEARVAESEHNREVMQSALRLLMDLPPETPVFLARRLLKEPEESETDPIFADLKKEMGEKRPEIKLLDVDLNLKRKESDRQWAYYFPDLFVDLRYKYVLSPEIEDIRNPFLNDPYNVNTFTAFLGLRYTFDLPLQLARHRQAKAKENQARHTRTAGMQKLELEAKKEFESFRENLAKMQLNEKGLTAGKKWMISEVMNYELGLADTQDVIGGISAYFKTLLNYWVSVHAVTLSRIKLEYLTSTSDSAPEEAEGIPGGNPSGN